MELLILDKNFASSDTLDVFESLIWTDRYAEYGDFELYMPANKKTLDMLPSGYYLYLKESEHMMIIEDFELDTDTDEGVHLKVTGRSLESILDRRIVWGLTTLTGSLQNGIKKLLDENIISPSDASRKIPNFVFRASTDERITALNIDAQYFGENLYDVIVDICKSENIGFKVVLEGSNFVFSLYMGQDRSYDQDVNPYVVFSPGFDNLMNSNYIESEKTLKTITLVAGEGEGSNRKTVSVASTEGGKSALERRELFTDAAGVSSTVDGGTLTDAEYNSQLIQKGFEELSKNKKTTSFEGEVDSGTTYTYSEDYYLGDVVQIANEFGREKCSQITEFVRSQDDTGLEYYPTFSSYEDVYSNSAYEYIRLTRQKGSYIGIESRFYTKTNTDPVIFMPGRFTSSGNFRYWMVIGRTAESVVGEETTPQFCNTQEVTVNNRKIYIRALTAAIPETGEHPITIRTEDYSKEGIVNAYSINPFDANNFYIKLAERMLPK